MVLKERVYKDWFSILVHVAASAPIAILIWDAVQDKFLVDMVREVTARTGKTALILLLMSLLCTPLRLMFGFEWPQKVRRPLGLFAFIYASLHFLTVVWLDYGLDWDYILQAITSQLYLIAGLIALIILTLMAITSGKKWKKRLGKKWNFMHKMAYAAILFASFHFVWLSKDPSVALRYTAFALLLILFRFPPIRNWIKHNNNSSTRRK